MVLCDSCDYCQWCNQHVGLGVCYHVLYKKGVLLSRAGNDWGQPFNSVVCTDCLRKEGYLW